MHDVKRPKLVQAEKNKTCTWFTEQHVGRNLNTK